MALENREPLFAHLLASRPHREQNAVAWLMAATINAALVALLLVTSSLPVSQRVSPRIMPTIVPVIDEPVPLATPVGASHAISVAPVPVSPATGSAPPAGISPPVDVAPVSVGEAAPVASKTLRERMGQPDPLLHAAPPSVPPPRTPLDEIRARIDVRLGSLNDSIAAEETARKKAKDWTVGADGNRWGISPAGIHLGKVTPRLAYATNNVPPPDVVVPPPGRRDEANARARTWQEIEAGAARAEQRAAFDQRVKSIRSRVDDARTRATIKKNK